MISLTAGYKTLPSKSIIKKLSAGFYIFVAMAANSDTNASTNDDTVFNNTTSTNPSPTVIAVTTSSGIILIGVAIIIIGCAISKRKKKREGEKSGDINPVYGIYQLGEDYERQYSTNVAVDNNNYYEQ